MYGIIKSMSYSKDLREKAVEYYLKGHSLQKTEEVFGVGKSSIGKWVKQYYSGKKKKHTIKVQLVRECQ